MASIAIVLLVTAMVYVARWEFVRIRTVCMHRRRYPEFVREEEAEGFDPRDTAEFMMASERMIWRTLHGSSMPPLLLAWPREYYDPLLALVLRTRSRWGLLMTRALAPR